MQRTDTTGGPAAAAAIAVSGSRLRLLAAALAALLCVTSGQDISTPSYSKGTAPQVQVGASPVIFTWSNINLAGTFGFDEGSCLASKPAVWFRVLAQNTGLLQISTLGCASAGAAGGPPPIQLGPGDNTIAVYPVSQYPPAAQAGVNCIASNNDFLGSFCATVQFAATAGTEYYVLTSSAGEMGQLPFVPYILMYLSMDSAPAPSPSPADTTVPVPTPAPAPAPAPAPTGAPRGASGDGSGGVDSTPAKWPSAVCANAYVRLSAVPRYSVASFVTEAQDNAGGVSVNTRTLMCSWVAVEGGRCPAGVKKACCGTPRALHFTVSTLCDEITRVTASPEDPQEEAQVEYTVTKIGTGSKSPYSIQIPVGKWWPGIGKSGRVKVCMEAKGSGCNSPAKMCNNVAATGTADAGVTAAAGCGVSLEIGQLGKPASKRCCATGIVPP